MHDRPTFVTSSCAQVCTERRGLEGGVVVGATGGLGGGDGGKGAVGCVLRYWLVFVGRHGVGLLSEKMMETKRDIKRVVRIAFSARAWVKFGGIRSFTLHTAEVKKRHPHILYYVVASTCTGKIATHFL